MNLSPLKGKLLVQKLPSEETVTPSGIVVTSDPGAYFRCRLVAGHLHGYQSTPLSTSEQRGCPPAYLLCTVYSGQELSQLDDDLLVIKEEDVLAVVEEGEQE